MVAFILMQSLDEIYRHFKVSEPTQCLSLPKCGMSLELWDFVVSIQAHQDFHSFTDAWMSIYPTEVCGVSEAKHSSCFCSYFLDLLLFLGFALVSWIFHLFLGFALVFGY